MKPSIIASASAAVFLLSGCGDNRTDLQRVKESSLEGYNALTVGQTMDNYKGCAADTQQWTSFTSDNGKDIVMFTCRSVDFMAISQNLVALFDKGIRLAGAVPREAMDLEDASYVFQFSMAKDKKTFNFEYSGIRLTWRDGKVYEEDNQLFNYYTMFYNNTTPLTPIFELPESSRVEAYNNACIKTAITFAERHLYAR